MTMLAVGCSAGGTEPPVDHVATSVAATLTAQPSRTPPPSATPIPIETELSEPSATPSDTPTAGPSPTATPPPLPPGDPRLGLNLSQPDYRDTFDTRFSWGETIDPSSTNLLKDGYFEATDHVTDNYAWWSTTLPIAGNVYAEIDATFSDCAGKDAAGLGIRIDVDNGYALEVSCDGHYRIRKFSGGGVESLLDWTRAAEIHAGASAQNRIGIVANGTTLHAVINGKALGSVEDSSFFSGTFALYANAIETVDFSVIFDQFELWYI
jgi:hypothetical protein